MKTTVYFVRHAHPDTSIKEDQIRPLSGQGMADTRKVTAALRDKGITAVYSSPFKRAVDTLKHFAEGMGLEIKTNENFRERKVGEWVEDFRSFSQNQWEDFDFSLEGGESLREVQERNIAALFAVLEAHRGESIAIATHGTALSSIINYFDPRFGYEDFWNIVDKMPYILCLSFDGDRLLRIEELELLGSS